MFLKFIMRYLANNEQLIEQLAKSKVMRRGAQWTVLSILKWRKFGNQGINELLKSPVARNLEQSSDEMASKLQFFSRRLTSELKVGVKEFKDEMKRRSKS